MKSLPPKVVLFDLDDTLFAHRASVDAGVAAHMLASGGAIAQADPAPELVRWNELEELHYHRYLSGERSFQEQRRARAHDFVAPFAELSDDDADSWFEAYLVEYEKTWKLHDDSLGAMDELAARIPGVRFGVITNGELSFQTSKMDGIRLTDRIEHLIASGEVGVTKPDPQIFHVAVEKFGVLASEAAYFGDRLRTDAIGAAEAGLTGVWLNRTGATPTAVDRVAATAAGVLEIVSLAELPALLAP